MPAVARPGVVTIQARVVGDIFGLMVYARAQKLTLVPPAVPWTTEHPRLARMAQVGSGVVALLAVAALGVWLRLRKRGRRRVAEAG